jgi:ribosomal protein S12 methylthiotransferase
LVLAVPSVTEESFSETCKATFALVSLGCPKNLVDSERMAGLLCAQGYRLVTDPAEADLAVINTCGFIADARAESYAAIAEMVKLKRQGKLRGIVVAGCLAERQRESLLTEFPEVDQLLGVFAREEIAVAADRLLGGLAGQRAEFRPAPSRPLPDTGRLRITPRHLAFLKIAEGCNRTCSFCAIPQMRGPYASKPIEEVVAEAEQLAADGVRELVLVAQDTSYYGLELYGRAALAELLTRLDAVEGLAWIRLMYLYPQHVTDALLDVLAGARKILPYLDLPLQHVSDEVLRRMRRAVSQADTEALLDRLRERIPNLVLRTTLIAGFPGETKVQFQELLEFVRRRRFERLGAFAFSPEPGTPAAELDGQLAEHVRAKRRDRLLAVQQEIAFAWNQAQVGRRLDVILDQAVPDQPGAYVGRSYADAPEIDGAVYVSGEGLAVGQIVPSEIVAARGYDLIAAATGDELPASRSENVQ